MMKHGNQGPNQGLTKQLPRFLLSYSDSVLPGIATLNGQNPALSLPQTLQRMGRTMAGAWPGLAPALLHQLTVRSAQLQVVFPQPFLLIQCPAVSWLLGESRVSLSKTG